MRRILLLLSLIVCSLGAGAQLSTWLWAKRAGGNSDQEGKSIASDAQGNVYVTGYISGLANDFDNIITSAIGGHDIFIAKYDSAGTLLWVKTAGSSAFDQGLAIATDGAGNAYVTGHFESSITFQGSTPVTLTSSGGKDIFIAKLDPSGNVLWAKKAGGTADDSGLGISTNGTYVFVTGYFRGTSTFGTGSLTTWGGKDIFIACYGAVTGTWNWALKAGSTSDDSGETIAFDGTYIYAAGTYQGLCSFANLSGQLPLNGAEDIYMVKYDIYGNGLWKKNAGGSNADFAKGIAISGQDLYLTGYFQGSLFFYNTPPTAATSLTAVNGDDAFIAKYDAGTGNIVWARSGNGSDDDRAYGIAVDQPGNVWITGEFKGSVPMGALPSLNSADPDAYVIKYDAAGNITDGTSGGGSNSDLGAGISTVNNKIYITGCFKSGNAQFGSTSITSVGNKDILVTKLGCRAAGGNASASEDTTCAGSAVTLTLANYGGSIQWQSSPAGAGSWSNINGATASSNVFTPSTNTDYRALVTQSGCDAGTSNTITVIIKPLPVVSISGNSSVCAGDSVQLNAAGATVYTWSPSSGLNSTTGNIVNTSPASNTTYTITGTTNGCSSAASFALQVKSLPLINITPSNSAICSGSSTQLTATGASAYTWSPAISLSSSTGASVTASPAITTTYTVTGTASNGCSANTTSIVNVLAPISSNSISGDQDICYGAQPAQIIGSIPVGGNGSYTYLWEESSDNVSWSLATGTNSLIDYAPPVITDTTYYRRRVISGSCASSFSSLSNTSTVKLQPSIANNTISSDQTMCSGSAPSMLTGTSPSGGDGSYSYLWMQSNDGNSWTPAAGTNNASDYSPPALSDTMYYIRTVSSGVCTGSYSSQGNTVTMNVQPAITGNTIITPSAVCEGTVPAALNGGTPYGGSGTYSYLWEESNDGNSWNAAAGSNNLQNYSPGLLSADTWYRRSVTSGMCTDTSQEAMITVNELPVAVLMSGSSTICSGDGTSLQLQLTGAAPWVLTYSDGSMNNTTSITSASYLLPVNPLASSTYSITSVTDNNGCTGTGSGSATITVFEKPVSSAGADESICGLSTSISAVPSVGTGSWSAQNGVIFNDPNQAQTSIALPGYGTYTITWTETNGICMDQDEVVITSYEQLQSIDAGADQHLYFTSEVVLGAEINATGTGSWSIISGSCSLSDPSSPNAIASNVTGNTVLQWTVTNGTCAAVSDEVTLYSHNVIIPSGFSPNGDNVNDRFYIEGIENYSSNIEVFDRWGNRVYAAAPYNNQWDGMSTKGEMLPDETYFYVLHVDTKVFNGYVVIKRK
jgi:gliding motility-associated-like protein